MLHKKLLCMLKSRNVDNSKKRVVQLLEVQEAEGALFPQQLGAQQGVGLLAALLRLPPVAALSAHAPQPQPTPRLPRRDPQHQPHPVEAPLHLLAADLPQLPVVVPRVHPPFQLAQSPAAPVSVVSMPMSRALATAPDELALALPSLSVPSTLLATVPSPLCLYLIVLVFVSRSDRIHLLYHHSGHGSPNPAQYYPETSQHGTITRSRKHDTLDWSA